MEIRGGHTHERVDDKVEDDLDGAEDGHRVVDVLVELELHHLELVLGFDDPARREEEHEVARGVEVVVGVVDGEGDDEGARHPPRRF